MNEEAETDQDRFREWLVQAHHTASQDFDKAIMALAGGALGLSLTFVDDYAPNPTDKWLLAVSWGLLALSLLVILVSYLTSQSALLAAIGRIDRDEEARGGGWLTPVLNWVAASALVVGVVFLVLFALYNL